MLLEKIDDELQRMIHDVRLLLALDDHHGEGGAVLKGEGRRQVFTLEPHHGGGSTAPVEQLNPVNPDAKDQGFERAVGLSQAAAQG